MEPPSDKELELREWIHQAERAEFERQERANRPFWEKVLVQILATSGQIVAGLFVLALLIYLAVEALFRYWSASYTPM